MTSSSPRSRKGASKNDDGAGRSPVVAVPVAPLTIDATKKSTSIIIPLHRRRIRPAQLLLLLLMVAFCFSALAFLTTTMMLSSQYHHGSSSASLTTTTLLPLSSREESPLLPLRLLQQEHNNQRQEQHHELDNNDSTSRNTNNINKQVVVASQNNNNNKNHISPSRSAFTVDILSVASIQQLDLLQAQRETFATHISVRNFFNATEHDDADPDCHKDLTWEDVQRVSSFCRNRPLPSGTANYIHPLLRHLRGKYARIQWLQKKKNPVGWLCAIVRPYSGLMKAYHHYRDNNNNNGYSDEGLPDYFIILDDDTYYNMEEFEKNFEGRNSSEELFYAGCLVRDPVHQINFTFPFGGFGFIFSKGTLRNLFAPIHCPQSSSSSSRSSSSSSSFSSSSMIANDEESTSQIRHPFLHHHSAHCDRIAENIVGEKHVFKTGMNLVELIYQYVNAHKYRDVKDWKYDDGSTGGGGFCMHSDWVIGYFVNYYNVSRHVMEPFYANVPHARIESYKNSEIYRKGTGFCRNEGINNCEEGSEICHKVTTQFMKRETDRLRSKVPEKFVSSG